MKKLNNILSFINKIFREETNKILLGRWSVNYCPISIKKKIDSGNNDHCGTCRFEKIQQKYDNEDDNNDEVFTNNQKVFTNNQKVFTNNQKVFTNNQKVFTNNQKVFTNNQKVFTNNQKDLKDIKQILK